ncbi:MAG: hypothetical protein H0X13_03445 [Ramlibacter sp.]|nr:hypothetical protein [Ramlibacter sp.]
MIFGHGSGSGTAQATTASSNVIVHAGLSAYGSLGFDTTGDCVSCVFTGSFSGNTVLAGQNQHSDIMLFVGTAPWTAEGATNCASGAHCGTGARMLNNTTIWGDANQRTKVQVGILVDGMLNATTSGNALYILPQALGACYRGPGLINDFANGHADGALQTEGSQGVHGCIGH